MAARVPFAAGGRSHRRGAAAGVDRDPARGGRAGGAAVAALPDRAPHAIRDGARSRGRRSWRVLDGGADRGRPAARRRSRTADPGVGERGIRAVPHRALQRPPLRAGLRDARAGPSIWERSAICAGSRSHAPRGGSEPAGADSVQRARRRALDAAGRAAHEAQHVTRRLGRLRGPGHDPKPAEASRRDLPCRGRACAPPTGRRLARAVAHRTSLLQPGAARRARPAARGGRHRRSRGAGTRASPRGNRAPGPGANRRRSRRP